MKRKVATGAILAIISAAVLGFGVIAYLPPQSTSTSTITMSTTTPSITATTTASSAATTITVSSSSTISTLTTLTSTTTTVKTTASTTTTTGPVIYAGKTVAIDPALQVPLFQSVLLSNNASQIANSVASSLNALPITLTGVTSGESFHFRTANGSSIIVTLVQGSFYRLDYSSNSTSTPGSSSRFGIENASESAASMMTNLGVPASSVNWVDQEFYLSPSTYELKSSQSLQGVPLTGALVTNSSGNYVLSISAAFQFNPQSSLLTGMTILSADWYQIPSGFPLQNGPSQAITLAADYAVGSLGVTTIASAQVSFVGVQNHLYYAVTLATGSTSYILFVNPRTGEVGLPTG